MYSQLFVFIYVFQHLQSDFVVQPALYPSKKLYIYCFLMNIQSTDTSGVHKNSRSSDATWIQTVDEATLSECSDKINDFLH